MSNEQDILSVSQLNQQAKHILQTQLGMIWVRGEISSLSRPSSGHWYFTLKDNNAQIRCAMFKGRNQLTRYQPQEGEQVLIRANVSIYEARGDYQLIAEHIEAEGEGRLRQAFELLKSRLATEGLFDAQHKQVLPSYPKHVAIVSSSTGAAVQDICSVFARRWPQCQLSIFPCRVQGSEAASEISQAIILANKYAHSFDTPLEAIIVGRGGGSLEDLQAFNEENVARAIFNSTLPIVSAVGHEIDFTISDFVADVRAATPSAAAEILSPDQNEIIQQLDSFDHYFKNFITKYLQQRALHMQALKRTLKHPNEKLNYYREMFKHMHSQLKQELRIKLHTAQQDLKTLRQYFLQQTPDINGLKEQLINTYTQSHYALEQALENKTQQLHMQTSLLNTISPLATLDRGYAIVSNTKQKIIYAANQVQRNEILDIKVAQGSISARVENTTQEEQKTTSINFQPRAKKRTQTPSKKI